MGSVAIGRARLASGGACPKTQSINSSASLILLLYLRKAGRAARSSGWAGQADPQPTDRAFVALRDQSSEISQNLMRLSSLATSVGMQMTEFHRGFEQFTFGRWEDHKQLQQKCQQMVRGLIAVRDRMEQFQSGMISPEKLPTLAETCSVDACEALCQAGIVEIPVEIGQLLDPSIHKCVGRRADGRPKDAVLEVIRCGYAVAGERDGMVPIRPAEVIVSSGPAKPEAGGLEATTGPAYDVPAEERRLLDKATPPRAEPCDGLSTKGTTAGRQNKRRPSGSNQEDAKR